ncbi:MAG: UDP-N-acetylmuramate dehydrogenase [Hahellaceae bacterium]|nr:UDP-N-acetylmuramate dehydrogenase [Hahellaceae bacterium]
MRHTTNVDLSDQNTLALPSVARHQFEILNDEDLFEALACCRQLGLTWQVMGGGSNVLLPSVIENGLFRIQRTAIEVIPLNTKCVEVIIGAGVNWSEFVQWSVSHGYGGVQNLASIPGTVGAAPVQNIGAYGVELQDVFVRARVFDGLEGCFKALAREDCEFGYRDSIFKRYPGRYIIFDVTLQLTTEDHLFVTSYGDIEARIATQGVSLQTIYQSVAEIRTQKLPDPQQLPNAGSFFKNPVITRDAFLTLKQQYPEIVCYPVNSHNVKLAAGWLIEQSGWKGKRKGHVGMHDKQALVLVNFGGADRNEVLAFAQAVADSVYDKFSVVLEPEPVVIPAS